MEITVFKKKIIASIVTYNPEIPRLRENVEAVLKNGIVSIVIVDNGSSNIQEIKSCCSVYKGIKLIYNSNNMGIAYALNQAFEFAKGISTIQWVLTLDQDTVIEDYLVSAYFDVIKNNNDIVSITSLRRDRAYAKMQEHNNEELEYVNRCITSGNLVTIAAWIDVNGFDERLFIDMVDYDFCYRLREKGFRIIRINKPCIIHELGKPTIVRFLGKERYVYNHNAMRKYYITRNYIYTLRNYNFAREEDSFLFIIRLFIKTLLYEKEDKLQKIKSIIKGIVDGFKMKRLS